MAHICDAIDKSTKCEVNETLHLTIEEWERLWRLRLQIRSLDQWEMIIHCFIFHFQSYDYTYNLYKNLLSCQFQKIPKHRYQIVITTEEFPCVIIFINYLKI